MKWPWQRRKAKAGEVTLSPALQGYITTYGPPDPDEDSAELSPLGSFSAAQMYRRQPAFRSVVDFLATNIAQIRMEVRERGSDGQNIDRRDHPLQGVLDHPLQGVPRSRFMRQVVSDKLIYDRALILKQRVGPDPADMGLVRVPPRYASVRKSSVFQASSFTLQAPNGQQIIIDAADAIYLHGYSPTSSVAGVSPAETLRLMLLEERAAMKDRENYYARGPRVGGVIEYPDNDKIPSPEGRQRQREDWEQRYAGAGATNAGGVAVIREGGRFRLTPTQTADEAQFVEVRQLLREEVCRAFGIAPQVLGITPANYATMDAYHQMLYQDALGPWWVWFQEEFEEQLLYADFEDIPSNIFLEFDLQAKLAGSFLEQIRAGQAAVGGPWMPRNEWRKIMNLPALPGPNGEAPEDPDNPYNKIIVPLNTALGGGPQANPLDAQNQHSALSNGNGHQAKHALEVAAWPTNGS